MANEEERPVNKLLAIIAAAALAGTGSSIGVRVLDNPRPDPFTGNDARIMKAEVLQKIKDDHNAIMARMGRLESRLNLHERGAEKWKFQIQSNKDSIEHHTKRHP